MTNKYQSIILFTDGASRGNPGQGGFAYAIYNDKNKLITQYAEAIGFTTNNQAEYKGIIAGLAECQKITNGTVSVYSDSNLAINQLNRNWKVKDPNIKPLFGRAVKLVNYFEMVTFTHVKRSHPKIVIVDALVNDALDKNK